MQEVVGRMEERVFFLVAYFYHNGKKEKEKKRGFWVL